MFTYGWLHSEMSTLNKTLLSRLPVHLLIGLVRDTASFLSGRVYILNTLQSDDICVLSTDESTRSGSGHSIATMSEERDKRRVFMNTCEKIFDNILIDADEYNQLRAIFHAYGEHLDTDSMIGRGGLNDDVTSTNINLDKSQKRSSREISRDREPTAKKKKFRRIVTPRSSTDDDGLCAKM